MCFSRAYLFLGCIIKDVIDTSHIESYCKRVIFILTKESNNTLIIHSYHQVPVDDKTPFESIERDTMVYGEDDTKVLHL